MMCESAPSQAGEPSSPASRNGGSEMAADLLENRRKNIELIAVRQESETANIVATVFVPDASRRSFPEKGRGISGRKYEAIRLHSLSLASTHVRVCVRRY